MWTQIVGKIRLMQTPPVNHSWHTTFYLTSRGLTTSPIPYGGRTFEINFDFIDHRLYISASDGGIARIDLYARSVADLYKEIFAKLAELDIHVTINPMPCEIDTDIRLDEDNVHASYDPEYANRFWRVLVGADRVFKRFRGGFIGKCSPVHFFWGAPDLAVTRFSGRRAPEHPGGVPHMPDRVTREAYSHEVSSLGLWPGNEQLPETVFYSYAYPEPAGYRDTKVLPEAAGFNSDFGEFILPYDAVRTSPSPDDTLLKFAQSTYEAAANCALWNRAELEREIKL
jgi:hypothetical protein